MLKAASFLLCAVGAAATPGSPVRPDYRWANASAVGAPAQPQFSPSRAVPSYE